MVIEKSGLGTGPGVCQNRGERRAEDTEATPALESAEKPPICILPFPETGNVSSLTSHYFLAECSFHF